MRSLRDLLVVELLGGIGDLLLVLPAVHALADAHPRARVRVLTFEAGAPLLEADPAVGEVVAVPKRPGEARRAVEQELARRRPDLAVSTTSYEGIPELLTAGAERAVTNLWRSPPPDELVDLRFLRLLAADGLIAEHDRERPLRLVLRDDERAAGHDLLARLAPSPGRPVLLLPDAGMVVKRWPGDRWVALTRRLADRPRLVVTGDDNMLSAAISDAGGVAVPPLPLRRLAALAAAGADADGCAVGADTGPLRLAQSVGLPVVGLFGPTLGSRYGPRPGLGVPLQGRPGCPVRRPLAITEQECWWTGACPLSAHGPACLADLTVDDVVAAVCGDEDRLGLPA